MNKLIKLSEVKQYLALYDTQQISISRFTELLNQSANQNLYNKPIDQITANRTKQQLQSNILHHNQGYYVTKCQSDQTVLYHVWTPQSSTTADSAHKDLQLAVARSNQLAQDNNNNNSTNTN
jgi:uncharacterized protein YbgA (DUF1722 family)